MVYGTKKAKYEALVNEVSELYAKGQPVLVGTISVETSELISNVQSNIKKGKRCPICSNRCGNSSKICSVCHTPFKQLTQPS